MIDISILNFHRARESLRDFEKALSQEDKERHLASAVVSAVAIVECLRGQVAEDKLRKLSWEIPRFRLLKRVRIHNFHRQPVPYLTQETRANVKFYALQGPIRLEAGPEADSQAWTVLTDKGPVYGGSAGGKVVRQPGGAAGTEKDIVIINGKLWDEHGESCVGLDDALRQFLNRVPQFLDQIQSA